MANFVDQISSNGSSRKNQETNLLALKFDNNFSLGDDGNFHCEKRPYPDFGSKEAVLSMVKMIKYVEEVKVENPKKEVFLIIDDKGSKLELTSRTRPSIIMAAINNHRPKLENSTDEERTENQIERSMDKAINSDPQFLKMMKDQKFLESIEKPVGNSMRR